MLIYSTWPWVTCAVEGEAQHARRTGIRFSAFGERAWVVPARFRLFVAELWARDILAALQLGYWQRRPLAPYVLNMATPPRTTPDALAGVSSHRSARRRRAPWLRTRRSSLAAQSLGRRPGGPQPNPAMTVEQPKIDAGAMVKRVLVAARRGPKSSEHSSPPAAGRAALRVSVGRRPMD